MMAAETSRRWLKLALIASVALNLVFVGAGVTRYFMSGPAERMSMGSQMQLFPRKFFAELERPRRAELLRVFRGYDPAFREGRAAARAQIKVLAAALAAEPYDSGKVQAAVEGFTARSESLAQSGGAAALTLIGKLSPEERKLLAQQLLLRDENMRGLRGSKPAQE
jgi:uncharacterized membrane protein